MSNHNDLPDIINPSAKERIGLSMRSLMRDWLSVS